MASVKKGTLHRAPQWWKHLRPYWRRMFWKRERNSYKQRCRTPDVVE